MEHFITNLQSKQNPNDLQTKLTKIEPDPVNDRSKIIDQITFLNSKNQLSYPQEMTNLVEYVNLYDDSIVITPNKDFEFNKYSTSIKYLSNIMNIDNVYYIDNFYKTSLGYVYQTIDSQFVSCPQETLLGVSITTNAPKDTYSVSFCHAVGYVGKIKFTPFDDSKNVTLTSNGVVLCDNLQIFDNVLLNVNPLFCDVKINNVKKITYIGYINVQQQSTTLSNELHKIVDVVDTNQYVFLIDCDNEKFITNLKFQKFNDQKPVELYQNDIKILSTYRNRLLKETNLYLDKNSTYKLTNVKSKIKYDMQYCKTNQKSEVKITNKLYKSPCSIPIKYINQDGKMEVDFLKFCDGVLLSQKITIQ